MRPKPKPGFLLVARREWRWLLHDRAALILIFGVPLFAFTVLTAVFSHPVIRDLGVVIVDADRSETSRAFAEEVAASSGLSIVKRAGDLASAARALRMPIFGSAEDAADNFATYIILQFGKNQARRLIVGLESLLVGGICE